MHPTRRLRLIRKCFGTVTALGLGASASAQQPAANPAVAAPTVVLPQEAMPGGAAVERLNAVAAPCPCAPAEAAAKTPPAPPPYAGPICERTTLTGDWLGVRGTLRDHGVTWDISSTNFYQGVTSGGLQRGFVYGGRGDIYLNINGEKAGLWKGLFIDLHGETLFGESANTRTGALMPINTSMISPTANPPVTALTQVKITQALSEHFLVFGGKINNIDGFNQPFTGGAYGRDGFMNAATLVPIVALRTIPLSTYGAGFAVLKDMEPVFSVAVMDPNNTPTVSGFDTFFNRGVSIIAQLNVPTNFFGLKGHQGVGGSYSNSKFAALDDLPYFIVQRLRGDLGTLPTETGSWSLFYTFDQALWTDPDNPKRSWGLFGNAGLADGNPNPVRWSAAIGLGGSSPFASRKYDSFGVGYYYVGLSDTFKGFAPRLVPLRDEHGVELFYNIGFTPWFHVTPDLQIATPTRDRVTTSLNFGVRAKIDF